MILSATEMIFFMISSSNNKHAIGIGIDAAIFADIISHKIRIVKQKNNYSVSKKV